MPSISDWRLWNARRLPSRDIEDGDQVDIDFDSGIITNVTKGKQYKGQAFPEFMQKLIAAGGLINYINNK